MIRYMLKGSDTVVRLFCGGPRAFAEQGTPTELSLVRFPVSGFRSTRIPSDRAAKGSDSAPDL